jgi:hypothetical protein
MGGLQFPHDRFVVDDARQICGARHNEKFANQKFCDRRPQRLRRARDRFLAWKDDRGCSRPVIEQRPVIVLGWHCDARLCSEVMFYWLNFT